ncbi:DNA-binding response OmpR family regulator [Sedimentibacter acidaminivorans]|uniref:DNA-binding response OmpR family regulator n=1 Tax=Sedimentibacter acidaminivorans TaxID=913099 RepID=A0ABS4GGZ9_9FIRM|nr:DNA-binding response OmpR family regulator [Sedimentibacter acidaminivorans]
MLVIEDKASLNESLVNMLNKERYMAFGEKDIDGGKKTFLVERPHIILLDIMLPNGNGYDLIPFFRKYHNSRILMITALDDGESKCISYENGADDYITKPFDLYELIYKLNAMRRRMISQLSEIQVGDIDFNVDTNKLTCRGKTFNIQPSQIKLLKVLFEKYEEKSYLDKSEFSEFFKEEMNENYRMQTLVARLRKNLSEIGSQEIIIETAYGKGYQLVVC